jgi:hypothetical protein
MAGRIVLLLLLIPTLASAGGNQAESGSGDEGERPGWAQRLYDYGGPPEYKVFEVAGHRFKVPYDYSPGSSEEDDHFQMTPFWPTLDPSWAGKPQPRHLEEFDTLQVTVSRFEDFERRVELIDSRIAKVRRAMRNQESKVERIASLLRIKGSPIFVCLDRVVLGRVEQPVQIVCDSKECTMSYMPFTMVEVQIIFDRQLLPDWRAITDRINSLLVSFKGP